MTGTAWLITIIWLVGIAGYVVMRIIDFNMAKFMGYEKFGLDAKAFGNAGWYKWYAMIICIVFSYIVVVL